MSLNTARGLHSAPLSHSTHSQTAGKVQRAGGVSSQPGMPSRLTPASMSVQLPTWVPFVLGPSNPSFSPSVSRPTSCKPSNGHSGELGGQSKARAQTKISGGGTAVTQITTTFTCTAPRRHGGRGRVGGQGRREVAINLKAQPWDTEWSTERSAVCLHDEQTSNSGVADTLGEY